VQGGKLLRHPGDIDGHIHEGSLPPAGRAKNGIRPQRRFGKSAAAARYGPSGRRLATAEAAERLRQKAKDYELNAIAARERGDLAM